MVHLDQSGFVQGGQGFHNTRRLLNILFEKSGHSVLSLDAEKAFDRIVAISIRYPAENGSAGPWASPLHTSGSPLSSTTVTTLCLQERDVHKLFKRQNPCKAAAPDFVSPSTLKHCADQLSPVFTDIFNTSLETCHVPACFKVSTIIPVPKKSRITGLNDYRPIALTSVVMKSFERLVLSHLKAITSPLLDPVQFTYRPNRSVDDAVNMALHFTLQHLNFPGTYARILFVDFRILLTVLVIFRILIVAIVGETVYNDEHSMFVCNTLQPGCNQACYDKAFPISHIRYWVFQIIMVCCPSLCFITYSMHQSAKQKERSFSTVYLSLEKDQESMKRNDSKKIKNTIVNGVLQNTENSNKEAEPDCLEAKDIPNSTLRTTKSKMRRQEGISRFYIIQVVFRNALEIGFLVGQYFLYGFNVPAVYECDRYPCIKDVECYVSRPTEKTVFLVFMFAVSGICVVLNLAELNHLGWRKIKTAVRGVQARRKSIYEIRNKDLPRMSMPNFGRTQSSDSAYV
ncbi:hypothetical protein F2P81_023998 [Scophthalmus maximus]|uniref:Gap junction protein n=1 Tax=Scophthalmus maximus TaxID=52904 RepID=A0A6A4RTJ3_SCOMX|nr:hypothetical protein F2P81_023998 [Scophthalmus maximus]